MDIKDDVFTLAGSSTGTNKRITEYAKNYKFIKVIELRINGAGESSG